MALLGNKAKAAALFVAVLIALYGTTEVAPIRKGEVRFGKSGGKFGKPTPGRSSYATGDQYAYRVNDPEYESD